MDSDNRSADRSDAASGSAGYETRDVSILPVFVFILMLSVSIVLSSGVTYWFFARFAAREQLLKPAVPPLAAANRPKLPPEPRLEALAGPQLKQLRAYEDHLLATYGWVDRQQGVVRIPIDRAMDLLAERGLPAREQSENDLTQ